MTSGEAEAATPAVIVVMGVSGTGKSTIAQLVAERLRWPLLEGDDVHPEANVEKMRAGIPLTDEDRAPWLRIVGDWIDARRAAGETGVVTCSALKRAYRNVLARPDVVFAHLSAPQPVIAERIGRREGHFMPAALLDSQYAALEQLQPDENGIVIDAAQTAEAQADDIVARLHLG